MKKLLNIIGEKLEKRGYSKAAQCLRDVDLSRLNVRKSTFKTFNLEFSHLITSGKILAKFWVKDCIKLILSEDTRAWGKFSWDAEKIYIMVSEKVTVNFAIILWVFQ